MRRQKRHGANLAHLAERAAVRGLTALLRLLPARLAVAVKERLRPTGRLDYPGAEVVMGFESRAALRRASACRKEPETVAWIEASVRPGDVFYDVGANVGAYSLVALAATGGRCRVVAFEPGVESFAALCANVRLNGWGDRVIPLQVALAEATGLIPLHYSHPAPGAALHHLGEAPADDGFDPALQQTVAAYRLDRLVEELSLPAPNHLKIDVDGGELGALRGAGRTLDESSLRSVLIEVDEGLDRDGDIPAYLEARGFSIRSRHRRGPSGSLFNVIFERPSA